MLLSLRVAELCLATSGDEHTIQEAQRKLKIHAGTIRQLYLGGYWLPQLFLEESDLFKHVLLDDAKFSELESFHFAQAWRSFDAGNIFERLNLTKVVKLNIPVPLPQDLQLIGDTIPQMHGLEHLHLRDIPDREAFMVRVYLIGDAVRNLPRLKSLGIYLMNPCRPVEWENQERFERPVNRALHFDRIFRRPVYSVPKEDALRGEIRRRAANPRDDFHSEGWVWKHPLALQKLYLKHIEIPDRAWTEVFSPGVLTDFHLPFGMATSQTWNYLKAAGTQLSSLQDLAFENLSPELLTFLGT